MKQRILHIGSEKMGTSSIQKYFTANRERLLAKHIWYPKSLAWEGEPVHRKFSDSIRSKQSFEKSGLRSPFEKEFHQAEEAGAETAVISSEFCHSKLRKPREVLRVRDFLRPHFDSVRIVFYARRQDQLLAGANSTAIGGSYSTSRFCRPTRRRGTTTSTIAEYANCGQKPSAAKIL